MYDIGVYAYLRALFFWEFRRVWAKAHSQTAS